MVDEQGVAVAGLPQVYVAFQVDQYQLSADLQPLVSLNKLKLDAKVCITGIQWCLKYFQMTLVFPGGLEPALGGLKAASWICLKVTIKWVNQGSRSRVAYNVSRWIPARALRRWWRTRVVGATRGLTMSYNKPKLDAKVCIPRIQEYYYISRWTPTSTLHRWWYQIVSHSQVFLLICLCSTRNHAEIIVRMYVSV